MLDPKHKRAPMQIFEHVFVQGWGLIHMMLSSRTLRHHTHRSLHQH